MAPQQYRVRNWSKFQHYKHRNPPWIKLHVEILSSEDWVSLDDASKLLAIACMVIASKSGGTVPDNPEYIKRVAYLDKLPNLKPLIKCGFLENPLAPASDCKQLRTNADTETETETETELEIESKKEDATPKGAAVVFNDASLPDWVDREAWAGYLEMRQRIRAPMTPRAKALAISTLEKLRVGGHDPTQVLDQSTQNSWKGVFPLKQEQFNGRQQSNHERAFDAAKQLASDILSGSHRLSGNGRENSASGTATITLLPTRANKPTAQGGS